MRRVQVVNSDRGEVLGTSIGVADTWWSRLRGLSGKQPLPAGGGLLLSPCRAVHMYGMRTALDVAFVDAQRRIVAVYHGLAPGRRTRWHRMARYALELPPGTLAASGTAEGDILHWQEVAA
jgi:uncharacterized membrane protein (UPF0127 family)